MGRLFGTDGIRGIANKDLTCELATKLVPTNSMRVRLFTAPKSMEIKSAPSV